MTKVSARCAVMVHNINMNVPPILAAALFLYAAPAFAIPAQVIVIRHGEKPPSGNELDERGRQRAAALVKFFETDPQVTKYGPPAAIYAMDPKDASGSLRPIQTVTPLADDLKITINHSYKREELQSLIDDLMKNPAADGKTVLICWEHKAIPEMIPLFGWASAPRAWSGSVFDRAWILDFNRTGTPVAFTDAPQRVLPGDSPE